MAFAPPSQNSIIYNPGNLIGVDDVSGAQKIVLDLSNYVRRDAGVFTSNIETTGNLIISNETQTKAFSDSKDLTLSTVNDKVSNVTRTNTVTTITGDLQVTNDLIIGDSKLAISKVSGLQTKLNEIDTNLSNIVSNDADIASLQTFKADQETLNTQVDNTLTDIDNSLATVDISLNVHQLNIDSLESDVLALETKDAQIDTSLNHLYTFEASQNTYNTVNDTNITDIQSDITTINTSIADIQSDITAIDTSVLSLQSKDSQIDTSLNAINTELNNLVNQDTILQTNITNNDNSITSLNGSVSTLNSTVSGHTTSISNLDTLTANHTTSISNLDTLIVTHDTSLNAVISDVSTLISDVSTAQSDILSNATNISLKQNILSSSNRLNASFIGDGSVSNLEFQTLYGINTGTSLEARLTSIQNSITNLDLDQTTLENLQNVDLQSFVDVDNRLDEFDTSLNLIITDVSSLQTNVASNIGRLNVKDSEISTINISIADIQADILANTSDITQNTSDIGTNQSNIASLQSTILQKQDIIDISNNLPSSVVSTFVNSQPDTLLNVLQSLRDVNDTQSSTIDSINSTITTLTNSIASNDVELASLQTQDITHSNQISTINSSISSINTSLTTKQDIIDGTNMLDSGVIFDVSENATLDNIIVRIDTDIGAKQDIIDGSNKLAISNVDLTGSNLVYADYGSSINSKFSSLDGQISTLTTLQNNDITNFTAIDENFTLIDTSLNQIISDISNVQYLDGVTTNIQSQIDGLISSNLPSLTYDSPTTTTTIANNTKVSKLIFNGDSSEQLTAFSNAKDSALSQAQTDISSIQGTLTTATGNISQNTSDILLKQNIIDGSNKLNPSYIDSGTGTMTAQKMEYLSTISEDINTKFTNIDSTLTSQATTNSSVSASIASLTSGKQDVLNNTDNFLNPEFIATSGAGVLTSTKTQYLSSITSDLQTQLDSKISSISNTFDDIIVKRVVEKIDASTISFASNILTVDNASGNESILYFDDLTSNTNFQLNMTNVPGGAFTSYTYTLWIECNTYQAYCNAVNVNGTLKTITFPNGVVDISGADSSSVIMQQITVLYLLSASNPDKVISNVTVYKAEV